jgi:hypothetical protein
VIDSLKKPHYLWFFFTALVQQQTAKFIELSLGVPHTAMDFPWGGINGMWKGGTEGGRRGRRRPSLVDERRRGLWWWWLQEGIGSGA